MTKMIASRRDDGDDDDDKRGDGARRSLKTSLVRQSINYVIGTISI